MGCCQCACAACMLCCAFPVSAFHTITVMSMPAVASLCPHGEHATARSPSTCATAGHRPWTIRQWRLRSGIARKNSVVSGSHPAHCLARCIPERPVIITPTHAGHEPALRCNRDGTRGPAGLVINILSRVSLHSSLHFPGRLIHQRHPPAVQTNSQHRRGCAPRNVLRRCTERVY